MKKMFTLVVALFTFFGLFAQSHNPYDDPRNDDRNTVYDNHRNVALNGRPEHGVEMQKNERQWKNDGRMSEGDRRAEMNRINKDYDRRINDYRNNSRMNRRDRDRAIESLRKERADKLKAFGGGVLLGGVLGVLLGTQL